MDVLNECDIGLMDTEDLPDNFLNLSQMRLELMDYYRYERW